MSTFSHTATRPRLPNLFVQICALNEQESIAQVIHGIPRAIEGVNSVIVVVITVASRLRPHWSPPG